MQMPGKCSEARRSAAGGGAGAGAITTRVAGQAHRRQLVLENDTRRSRWHTWSGMHRQLVGARLTFAVPGGAHGAHARHDVGAMALINTGCSDISCCFSRGDMAGLRTLVVEVSSSHVGLLQPHTEASPRSDAYAWECSTATYASCCQPRMQRYTYTARVHFIHILHIHILADSDAVQSWHCRACRSQTCPAAVKSHWRCI